MAKDANRTKAPVKQVTLKHSDTATYAVHESGDYIQSNK